MYVHCSSKAELEVEGPVEGAVVPVFASSALLKADTWTAGTFLLQASTASGLPILDSQHNSKRIRRLLDKVPPLDDVSESGGSSSSGFSSSSCGSEDMGESSEVDEVSSSSAVGEDMGIWDDEVSIRLMCLHPLFSSAHMNLALLMLLYALSHFCNEHMQPSL
jgi:hypothetical protein